MRPFRFFFALSLGVIIFMFLARFVLIALFMAVLFSILYYAGRKLYTFFSRLRWDGEEDEDRYDWVYGQNRIGADDRMWYHETPQHRYTFDREYRAIIIE